MGDLTKPGMLTFDKRHVIRVVRTRNTLTYDERHVVMVVRAGNTFGVMSYISFKSFSGSRWTD